MSQHPKLARDYPWALLGIIAIAVVLRLAAAFFMGDRVEILPGTYDQISYHNLALRVLDGHGFSFGKAWWPVTNANAPTAHWSFLYTFYLVFVYAITGPHPLAARLIQAILIGIAQPLLTYLIGRRLFGEIAGMAAAALSALYVYFIYYAVSLMTEPFYITAILGALYLVIRMVDHLTNLDARRPRSTTYTLAIGLALVLGIAVLLRQLYLLFIPILFLWIWWASRKPGARSPVPALLLCAIIIVGLVLPFTRYNYSRFGRFVLLNTNAGYAFFWANHPVYGTHFEPILPAEMGTYQSLIPEELRHLDEAALDQELLKRGVQFVSADPGRYFLLSLSRIPAYFMFWPSSESSTMSNLSRVASFGLLFPFMLYGLFLALFVKERRNLLSEARSPTFQSSNLPSSNTSKFDISSPVFLLVLFALSYTLIHLLSWALIRYRLPVDAVMLVFAGLAVVDLVERVATRSQANHPQNRSAHTH